MITTLNHYSLVQNTVRVIRFGFPAPLPLSAGITVSVTQEGEKEDGTLPVAVTGIEMSPADSILIVEPGGTLQLTAAVKPDNADNTKIRWSASPSWAADVDETGKVSVAPSATPGNTITVTATSDGDRNIRVVKRLSVMAAATSVTGVRIDPAGSVSAKPYETVQLTATVLPKNFPNRKVLWNVSPLNAATVDTTGLVTIGSHNNAPAGSTIIVTAASDEDNSKTAAKWITVEPYLKTSPEVYTCGITRPGSVVSVALYLNMNFTPDNDEAVWTSSDQSVCTVRGYVGGCFVYGEGVGRATITVSANYQGTPVTATCAVIVESAPVTSFKIVDVISKVPQGSYPGYSAVLPADSWFALGSSADSSNVVYLDDVTWSSSNTGVATVESQGLAIMPGHGVAAGVVTGVANGTVTITATHRGGLSDSRTVTVFTEDTADLAGNYTWDAAVAVCAAKGTGWRLPTRDELNAISVHQDGKGYTVSGPHGPVYWSGTDMDGGAYARSLWRYVPGSPVVDSPFSGAQSKTSTGMVRCVK